MKRTVSTLILVSALLIIVLTGTFTFNSVQANPIPIKYIIIDSPSDNNVYFSTTIPLNFTVLPDPEMNFSSLEYSLDGNLRVTYNGSAALTGLSYGSHTLTVYGIFTHITHNQTYGPYEEVSQAYFGVGFTTEWIVVSSVLLAFVCSGLLLRKRLINAFRGKKTGLFWFGVIWVLFFAAVTSLPLYEILTHYLYPHYSPFLLFSYSSNLIGAALGVGFMLVGFYFMKISIKKDNPLSNASS